MTRPIKNLSGAVATGDATHVGTNDIDQTNNLLTGQDQSATDPVTLATTTTFNNAKLRIKTPTTGKNLIINTTDVAADKNVTIPALSADDTVAFVNQAQTLAAKTLTSPVISSISNTGIITLPTVTDTLVGRTTTDIIRNKTLDLGLNTLLNFGMADYTVYIDVNNSNKYTARNNVTGATISNTSFSSLMATLNTNLASGGTIFLMSGTYNIDATITISNNISIIGNGRGNTILLRTMVNATALNISGNNLTIARLTFNSNYPTVNNTSGGDIVLTGTNILVTDIEGTAFGYFFFTVTGQTTISQCYLHDATSVLLNGSGPLWSDSATAILTLSGCKIFNTYGGGMFLGGISTIKDCYIGNTTKVFGGGQIAAGASAISTKIINCTIEPDLGNGHGIEMSSGGEWIIMGNRIRGQNGYGIVSNVSPDYLPCTITGNFIKNCGQNLNGCGIGMTATNQKYFTIANNFVYDDQGSPTQRYGILILLSGSDNYIIKDNTCYGSVAGQIVDNGTGTHRTVTNNIGYNPVGVITNPFPTSGAGNIQNYAQTAAVPASGTVQTVVATPKTIIQTGGTVTVVAINGTTVATAAGNYTFKLGIGETYSVTYSAAPTIQVYCE